MACTVGRPYPYGYFSVNLARGNDTLSYFQARTIFARIFFQSRARMRRDNEHFEPGTIFEVSTAYPQKGTDPDAICRTEVNAHDAPLDDFGDASLNESFSEVFEPWQRKVGETGDFLVPIVAPQKETTGDRPAGFKAIENGFAESLELIITDEVLARSPIYDPIRSSRWAFFSALERQEQHLALGACIARFRRTHPNMRVHQQRIPAIWKDLEVGRSAMRVSALKVPDEVMRPRSSHPSGWRKVM